MNMTQISDDTSYINKNDDSGLSYNRKSYVRASSQLQHYQGHNKSQSHYKKSVAQRSESKGKYAQLMDFVEKREQYYHQIQERQKQ